MSENLCDFSRLSRVYLEQYAVATKHREFSLRSICIRYIS